MCCYSPCGYRCVIQLRWAYAMPVYVLFISRTSNLVFNQSICTVTDNRQSEKDIDPYFKLLLCGPPRRTKSRYSFDRICWVNPERKRRTEINFCHGLDLKPQHLDRQSIIIIILAYFYCGAYTEMNVIESPTNCNRRCITKLINSHRRDWIDGFQMRFESLSIHNRCQFAQQAVPESGSGVRKCSLSYLET